MSRGTKLFSASAGFLALALTFTWASPAAARTVSSAVSAVDNKAPDAPTAADAFPGAGGVELSWTASPSEGSRPSPVGGDFTSFGTFSNVSDVSGYNVWFSESGEEFVAIPGPDGGAPTVGPGVTAFLDAGAVSGPSYVYRITAWDGTNDSDPAETAPVSLGPPPVLNIEVGPIDLGTVGPAGVASATVDVSNDASDAEALLFLQLSVDGDGFNVDPASLTVDPGASATFDVTFDAAGVGDVNGTYEGTLRVGTNDPDPVDRVVEIALSATVEGGADVATIAVSTTSISFGQVLIGETSDRVVTISNSGGLDLEVSAITVSAGEFSIDEAGPITVAGGAEATVTVTFSPVADATSSATLTIASNDADQPSIEVALSGEGVTELSGPGAVQQSVQSVQITLADDLVECNDAFLESFRNAIAAALGISASRILVDCGDVTAGSTIVDFQIIDDPDGVESDAATVAATLATTVTDDPTVFADLGLGDASGVTAAAATVSLLPLDPNGNPILGWFNRGAGQAGPIFKVGLDDFFLFGDAFGSSTGDPAFNVKFDIAGPANSPPDGDVGFDDFFKFGDDFGKVVDNAAEIQALLGI